MQISFHADSQTALRSVRGTKRSGVVIANETKRSNLSLLTFR